MKPIFFVASLCGALLGGCQTTPPAVSTRSAIQAELASALGTRPPTKVPERISGALLPAMASDLPKPAALAEPRFDLVVNNAPVAQVFNVIASGSRYSILVPASVTGTVSLNLKDVTTREALEVLREMHGLEYRIDGTRVFVQPASLQTRLFQVNYGTSKRVGRSDTRVISGSISSGGGAAGGGNTGGAAAASGSSHAEGSQVSTTSDSDFWKELDLSLKTLIGSEGGRQIVLSPHTGVVIVKAFPKELREVENFLRSAKLSIERQVMLEAKIVEVSLREGFESGINWASLSKYGNHNFSVGADPNRINVPGSIGRAYGVPNGSLVTGVEGSIATSTTLGQLLASPFTSGGTGLLAMAVTTSGFEGLLAFLETQGSVQVLSSPRVAAVNNQKAVLRVGTDDFFITNISTTTTASAGGSVTTPSITVQPFFSGIALDVTPQIDDEGTVTMHVRPSVSEVTERSRVVNLGNLGSFTLPLASSNVNETDTVVRVQDGTIVAIGGLMQQSANDNEAKVPVAGDVPLAGHLFKRTQRSSQKRELVFLIKPTVIKGDTQWREDIARTDERVRQMGHSTTTAVPTRKE
jgi:MSHA biogenesis protein MshL